MCGPQFIESNASEVWNQDAVDKALILHDAPALQLRLFVLHPFAEVLLDGRAIDYDDTFGVLGAQFVEGLLCVVLRGEPAFGDMATTTRGVRDPDGVRPLPMRGRPSTTRTFQLRALRPELLVVLIPASASLADRTLTGHFAFLLEMTKAPAERGQSHGLVCGLLVLAGNQRRERAQWSGEEYVVLS
jgi:hypothetical protein